MVIERLINAHGPAAWLVLLDGALGRGDLDKAYRQHAPRQAPQPARLARHQVVGAVVGHALQAYAANQHTALQQLCAIASKRSRTETRLIAALSETEACAKLTTYGGMQFKRQRARMIWAALSDERAPVRDQAMLMLDKVLKAAQSGEDQIALPAPEVTGEGRSIPALKASKDSAKLGKLQRALRSKDEEISALRRQLHETRKAEAAAKGAARRAQDDDEYERHIQRQAKDEQRESKAQMHELTQALNAARQETADLAAALERTAEALKMSETVLAQRPTEAAYAALQDEKKAWQHERQVLLQRSQNSSSESPQGVVLLFDAANLGAGARSAGGHVDFPGLKNRLAGGRTVRRALAFAVADPGPERSRFEEALRTVGIDVRWKQTRVYADGSKKADWDVALAVEALAWAGRAETVIIASGDGDFLPLIEALRQRGTALEAAGWPGRTHEAWRDTVHCFHPLDAGDLLR